MLPLPEELGHSCLHVLGFDIAHDEMILAIQLEVPL